MCDSIIWNTCNDNGLCMWCNRKLKHFIGNVNLNTGEQYVRDDNGRPIGKKI